MRTSIVTGASVLVLLAANPVVAAPTGHAPIIEGEVSRADAPVVALALRSGTIYCSGTLVSPRVVVTAGHCLHGVAPPAKIFFGTDPGADGAFVPVELAMAHPDYAKTRGLADIGLVILARPVTIPPVPLVDRNLASPAITGTVRLVGFGDTAPQDPGQITGVKFDREVPLTKVSSYFLDYGVGACVGDSGGPTLARDESGIERLVGVISRGDSDCLVYGSSTRVDLYRDWIASWIASADKATCELDMRCSTDCPGVDPDCIDVGVATNSPRETSSGGCSSSSPGRLAIPLLALAMLSRRRRS